MTSSARDGKQRSAEWVGPVDEGYLEIDTRGHRVFYRVFGAGSETILGLHGGPGGSQRSLTRLAELGDEFRIVLFDQLGGGLSDRPSDPELWTVTRFIEEVEAVRTGLGLGAVHVLGRSWGGMLALEHALAHPDAVRSLILSNTGASTAEILAGMDALRREVGKDAYATLVRAEAIGRYGDDAYVDVLAELLARHNRRVVPFDIAAGKDVVKEHVLPHLLDKGPAFGVMWGANEFVCTGTLRSWTVLDRLGEIRMPTLILCGLYDEVTVDVHRSLAGRIPDNEFVIFGNSSHTPLFEREAEVYLAVVRDFVRRAGSAADGSQNQAASYPAEVRERSS
jgi:proline iminopeptidase